MGGAVRSAQETCGHRIVCTDVGCPSLQEGWGLHEHEPLRHDQQMPRLGTISGGGVVGGGGARGDGAAGAATDLGGEFVYQELKISRDVGDHRREVQIQLH